MPNIKLKNQSGTEITYNNVDVISIPLADGSGNFDFGLTDDELTMDATDNHFVGWEWVIDKYGNRIKVRITSQSQSKVFGQGYTKDLNDIKLIEKEPGQSCDIRRMFNSYDGKKLPVPIWEGTKPIREIEGLFEYCRNLTDTEIKSFLSHFNFSGFVNANINSIFNECRSVRNINSILAQLHAQCKNYVSDYGGNVNIQALCRATSVADELVGIPVPCGDVPYDSQISFWDNIDTMVEGASRAKRITFATKTEGTPYTVKWDGKTISLFNQVGYTTTENDILDQSSVHGITQEKRVSDATTYEALKNDPDYYVYNNDTQTYDGNDVNIGLLYSRYNHTSAVETINSLPDCSAYCAETSNTNTIVFRKYSGALTDGGGINTLTAEEIAVATNKGWTVSLVV